MIKRAPLASTCSTREAADLLGISVRTAQLWVEEGRLRAWKTPGGHRRILRESVDRLRAAQDQESGTPGSAEPRLLVVARERDDRLPTEVQLAKALPGWAVLGIGNAVEALLRLAMWRPTILVVDASLPGIDVPHLLATLGEAHLCPGLRRVLLLGDDGEGAMAGDAVQVLRLSPALAQDGVLAAVQSAARELNLGEQS